MWACILTHYTKGTYSQYHIAPTAYMSANSGSISPVIYLLFIFPLQYFSLSLNMPYLA